ncbi:hypothetical protein [Bacillus andreraoultii]|uniref:hypothetical protein n=1 Tax=Bacillus andreraoultii TaxID=1499685 RepID=UPI00053B9B9E|nr:hypothetical protein [Bacillus andreraoultii]
MNSRKEEARNLKKENRHRLVLWTLRIVWLIANMIAINYWRFFGWWFLIVCSLILISGLVFIEKRLQPLEMKWSERKIQKKYPFMKNLKDGEKITIEMKNGECLKNAMLVSRVDKELLVLLKPDVHEGFVKEDIRTIKLKSIKTITPSS